MSNSLDNKTGFVLEENPSLTSLVGHVFFVYLSFVHTVPSLPEVCKDGSLYLQRRKNIKHNNIQKQTGIYSVYLGTS
jgi:hypothetical protein